MTKGFCLEVTGDFACFTRPEMKVERVSYDVITPSAARGIFSSIFWKPAILWKIKQIDVLNPIRWTTIRRNEVASVAGKGSNGIFIEEDRQQRAGLILRDVAYRIYAEFDFIPPEQRSAVKNPSPDWLSDEQEKELYAQVEKVRPDEKPAKYAAMFERRATKGQYFAHPYFGCREFSCKTVRLIKFPEQEERKPITEDRDLGFMLYDMDFSEKETRPMFFRPVMKQGVIMIPDMDSEEVYK